MSDSPTESGKSWLDRHPAILPLVATCGFLQVFLAIFMLMKYRSLGPEASAGMALFGILAAPVTLLVLLPFFLLLRRFHPAWKRGDRATASWSLACGLTVAVAAWMIADRAAASVQLSGWPESLWETLFTLATSFAAATWVIPPRKGQWALAALVPLAFLAVALAPRPDSGGAAADDRSARVRPAPPGSPDVVLVSIDTLRADRLGAYGRSPSITPGMDRLADEGAVFTRALAAAPWTVPSVASMITGLPTLRHGAGNPMGSGATFRRTPLPADVTTLAEHFAAAGYRTRGVAANGFVSGMMGLDQGFEVFDNTFNRAMGSSFLRDLPWTRLLRSMIPQEQLGDYRAEGVTNQALAWLAEEDDAPLFLWAHYLGPHVPLRSDPRVLDTAALEAMLDNTQPTPGEDGSVLGTVFTATAHVRSGMLWLSPEDKAGFVKRYDLTVEYVDEHVGRLFDALRERDRPVIAVLTSDHGEELWDHGHFEHGHDYYREVTQIPLLFWGPGVPAGRTIDTVVGHVDITPTLLDLANLTVPPATAPDEGRSLVPLFQIQETEGTEAEEAESAEGSAEEAEPMLRFSGGNLYGLPAVLVEDTRWRFILRANGREELYDIQQDPQERFNVALEHPQVAADFRELLEPRLTALIEAEGGTEAELTPEQMKALQSLGYVQ